MAKLSFSVVIGEPELITPESPTPAEFKYLSNLDDQPGIQYHLPFIHYYNPRRAGEQRDPPSVIRRALSKALVHYYPLAGRLRHGEKGKLVVDCCAEGVVFREADADVTLDQLKMVVAEGLRPPSPFLSKFLLDDIWDSVFVTDSPLLRMQVTRLKCGGFVLAYIVNHCLCDSYGVFQFVTALSELAQEPNRSNLTQPPVWARELLTPRSPPRPSFPHREYDPDPNMTSGSKIRYKTQMISIFFTRSEISALKSQINGQKIPTFVAITALLWRAWTRSLGLRYETRLLVPIDTRGHHRPLLPDGYYGMAVVIPCAVAPAKELVSRPISFAAGLISELKSRGFDKEYRASTVDFIEMERRFWFRGEGALLVTDVSKLRFADVDFGWGPALYGGLARGGRGGVADVAGLVVTSLSRYKREDGVEGLVALLSLPRKAVNAFQEEVRRGIALRSAL
ncbi:hypothetical protein J5N97_027926 [Dioscorea zingiberensis]|uniref:Benzyl alcohol O-benzoyltransferase n=1 Tax=Dioscorea zingiberensis TaxID=325984 RepID=A0A9D5BY24_9LILI|nr:hypothetical protein J5N97_027926 [Dioscorea zingiberensis]